MVKRHGTRRGQEWRLSSYGIDVLPLFSCGQSRFLQLPHRSTVSFGRLNDLHYIDLPARYGRRHRSSSMVELPPDYSEWNG